jgi:holin-like protein
MSRSSSRVVSKVVIYLLINGRRHIRTLLARRVLLAQSWTALPPGVPIGPMLQALTTLLIFQLLGEALAYLLRLPVPGPVIGMAALFAWLLLRPQAIAGIKPAALEILRHLSLLFVPAGVGVMLHGERLAAEGWKLLLAVLGSTVITIAVTGLVGRWAIARFAPDRAAADE